MRGYLFVEALGAETAPSIPVSDPAANISAAISRIAS
jgi:hypothetical protein